MPRHARYIRYLTATKFAELRGDGVARLTYELARTYNIVQDEWTEWRVVPDDDPRVDTVEDHGRA